MTELYSTYEKTGRLRAWLIGKAGVSLGSWGEWAALRYFRRKGWELVARNWTTRSGEIDLIFYDRQDLVFVEVKTRLNSGRFTPEDNFSREKLAKMEALAWSFLERFELGGVKVRYDLAAVETEDRGSCWIRHYQGLGES
jgi:putative endonuclease